MESAELLECIRASGGDDFEADLWLGGALFSTHLLAFKDGRVFDMVINEGDGTWYSVAEWLRYYENRWWMVLSPC